MEYTEVTFYELTDDLRDIMIAVLTDHGFEGFEESGGNLKAFIASSAFKKEEVDSIAEQYHLKSDTQAIASQNWNSVWESNFNPVVVGAFCTVRASFHPPAENTQYELIITPKMSFGTGHHATTFMMIARMEHLDIQNKKVLDYGTGTGVLALLAWKMGAADLLAVDNDSWSIENASENFKMNGADQVKLLQRESAEGLGNFDIILANITRNVISDNFNFFTTQLTAGGTILFSGLLEDDEQHILELAETHKLVFAGKSKREKWICLEFNKA